jgi:hypothetical protein
MNVKLIMNWDIKPGHDQEYFEFLVKEWIPGTSGLGLKHSGAWVTTYSRGDTPQIMTEGIAKDFAAMRNILDSHEWEQMHTRLLEYVMNYEQKIVRVTGSFQM